MTDERWDIEVAKPCKALVNTLAILTEGWAKGVVLIANFCLVGAVCCVCTLLSPLANTLGARTDLSWVPAVVRGIIVVVIALLIYIPLAVAGGPAAIGTACDNLTDKLNSIRLNKPTEKNDIKVGITERALGNTNHGQGLGFKVLGVVLDKAMMARIAVQLGAAAWVALPFIISSYVSIQPITTGVNTGSCSLSAPQVTLIKAAASLNGTCSYDTVSIGSVMRLKSDDSERACALRHVTQPALIVLGGDDAGTAAAYSAAKLGVPTLLVLTHRRDLGGDPTSFYHDGGRMVRPGGGLNQLLLDIDPEPPGSEQHGDNVNVRGGPGGAFLFFDTLLRTAPINRTLEILEGYLPLGSSGEVGADGRVKALSLLHRNGR